MRLARILLSPISIIYYIITHSRNWAFDKNLLKSKKYDTTTIVIGNLSVGGTGKSPMTMYLTRLLSNKYPIAILSRGYGRKTKGFIELKPTDTTEKVGDEPLQLKSRFQQTPVAVCEDRCTGIEHLNNTYPNLKAILLDDAYQHRKLKASYYILLTMYNKPYYKDYMLPLGNLREARSGSKRAHIIIVTKCPKNLDKNSQEVFKNKLKLQTQQKLFFSYINYPDFLSNHNNNKYYIKDLKHKKITLVTGIANPTPLVKYYQEQGLIFEHLKYQDHHNFSKKELEYINQKAFIITTEKDFMRLKNHISPDKIWYQSMDVKFLNQEKENFDNTILKLLSDRLI